MVTILAFLFLSAIFAWKFVPHTHVIPQASLVRPLRVNLKSDFTNEQITRNVTFHNLTRPIQLSLIALDLISPLLLAFFSWIKQWFVDLSPVNITWWLWSGLALVVFRIVRVPLEFRLRSILTEYGLNTQTTSGWLMDVAKSTALSTSLALPLVALLIYVSQLDVTMQLVVVPAGAIVLTFLFSFLIPVFVEPLFNKFTPMDEGPLRTSLLELSREVGAPVSEVLVADASRRTTALNAYVSGISASRRVVVYDTMLNSVPPDQVKMVVAHELGHAVHNDVWRATVITSLVAAATSLLAVLVIELSPGWEVMAISAVMGIVGLASSPVTNLMSRQIERRADAFALQHANIEEDGVNLNSQVFIEMQKELALTNISNLDLSKSMYLFFATHPTCPERIAMARIFSGRDRIVQ